MTRLLRSNKFFPSDHSKVTKENKGKVEIVAAKLTLIWGSFTSTISRKLGTT